MQHYMEQDDLLMVDVQLQAVWQKKIFPNTMYIHELWLDSEHEDSYVS